MNVMESGIRYTSMRSFGFLFIVVAGLFGWLAISVSTKGVSANSNGNNETTTNGGSNSANMRSPRAEELSERFRVAAKQSLPCVVEIKAAPSGEVREFADGGRFQSGAIPFRELFEDKELDGETSEAGLGCGVVIDAGGLVLTNHHVAETSNALFVELPDGRQFRVTDVQTDSMSDLALLTLECAVPLPVARLGDSDSLQIGDWVLTIGSPFGLEQTVSAGIISATGRSIRGASGSRLQTDAAINPGSSGGALINLQGEIIGITTAIASRDGGYQGVGFAIPINRAKWVVEQFRKHGHVRRGYLGATFATRPGSRELEGAMGLHVTRVIVGSPAQRAGLREGDAVISIDGQPTGSVEQLNEFVERGEIGAKHRLEIVRDQARTRVEITIEEAPLRTPSRDPVPPARESRDELVYSRDLGIVVSDVNDRVVHQLGLQNTDGVLVVRTDRGGSALRAGIRKGMVIVRVGNRPTRSSSEFAQVMENESLEAGIRVHVHGRGGLQIIDIGGPGS